MRWQDFRKNDIRKWVPVYQAESQKYAKVYQVGFCLGSTEGQNVELLNSNGAAMILIALKMVSPNTRVGVSNLKKQLTSMSPGSHGGDVGEMLLDMVRLKQEILEKGSAHEDFILNILDAVGRSKDPNFINFVSKLRDNWESAEILDEIDSDEVIIDKMTTKWNNIVARKGNDAKKDPPDAKFTALSSEPNCDNAKRQLWKQRWRRQRKWQHNQIVHL